jgi:hypothetical protein
VGRELAADVADAGVPDADTEERTDGGVVVREGAAAGLACWHAARSVTVATQQTVVTNVRAAFSLSRRDRRRPDGPNSCRAAANSFPGPADRACSFVFTAFDPRPGDRGSNGQR